MNKDLGNKFQKLIMNLEIYKIIRICPLSTSTKNIYLRTSIMRNPEIKEYINSPMKTDELSIT